MANLLSDGVSINHSGYIAYITNNQSIILVIRKKAMDIFVARDAPGSQSGTCVLCDPTDLPQCACSKNEMCIYSAATCSACTRPMCIPNPSSAAKTNTGGIAGGVVAGIIVISAVTFFVWWFWIRPKRQEELEEEWEAEEEEEKAGAASFELEGRSKRASVHTVASRTSTMLSRASNIIPIAFIPGVTADGSVPPVPPIPAARNFATSPGARSPGAGSAIFFSPGDLRNSAYSSTSTKRDTYTDRASISPSLARESIASDIYHDDATAHPMPAQHAVMTRPNMVSVVPPSLTSDAASDRSSISSAQLSPRIAMQSVTLKPQTVTIGKKANARLISRNTSNASSFKPTMRSPLAAHHDSDTDEEEDEEDPHARARQSLLRNRDTVSTTMSLPLISTVGVSPFADPLPSTVLASVMEEGSIRRSSTASTINDNNNNNNNTDGRSINGNDNKQSPFSDVHAVEKH